MGRRGSEEEGKRLREHDCDEGLPVEIKGVPRGVQRQGASFLA